MEVVNFDEQNGHIMVVEGAQEETDFEEVEGPANLEIGLALIGTDSKASNLDEGKEMIELQLIHEVGDLKLAENMTPEAEEGIEKTTFHDPWFRTKFFVFGFCGPMADLVFDLYNAYSLYSTDSTFGSFAIGIMFVPSVIASILISVNYQALDRMKKYLPLISGKVTKIVDSFSLPNWFHLFSCNFVLLSYHDANHCYCNFD